MEPVPTVFIAPGECIGEQRKKARQWEACAKINGVGQMKIVFIQESYDKQRDPGNA
jgi:hypothetical protein